MAYQSEYMRRKFGGGEEETPSASFFQSSYFKDEKSPSVGEGYTGRRAFDVVKAEYEAAQKAEQSALNAANQYVSDNMGQLDMKDPAELQALNDAAAAATEKLKALEKEYYSYTDESYEDKVGGLGDFGKAASTVIAKPFLSVDVLAETARNAAKGNEMDMDAVAMQKYSQMGRAREDALSETSGAGRWLAENGLSIADSLYSRVMGMGTPLGAGLISGAEAAADKAYNAGQSGDSAGRALARGVTSGIISGGAEALSVGNLATLLKKDGAKTLLGFMLKQGGFEASEEAVDYTANWIADKAFKDPDAKFSFGELINSALSGGFSGAFFGALGGAKAKLNQSTNSGAMPGSGLDGTPTAQDGVIPYENRVPTQNTPSAAPQTDAMPGMDVSGQFGAVEGEKKSVSRAETANTGSAIMDPDALNVIYGVYADKNNIITVLRNDPVIPGEETETSWIKDSGGRNFVKAPVTEEQIAKNRSALSSESPVVRLSGKEFPDNDASLVERVAEFFRRVYQNKVPNREIGYVDITRRGVKDSTRHGMSEAKGVSFAAVPEVIKHGLVIDTAINHSDRGYDTYTIAAPVEVLQENGGYERQYVGAIVKRDGNGQRYYLHEVLTQKELASRISTGAADNSGKPGGSQALYTKRLLQSVLGVNSESMQNGSEVFTQTAEQGMIPGAETVKQPADLTVGETTDAGYWDSIMEEHGKPFSETDVDGYMDALLADVDERLNRATPKDTPVTYDYEKSRKGKAVERDDKSPTADERVKEIVLDPDVTSSESITPEFAQALTSTGVSYNKDLARNLDAAGAASTTLREGLRNLIERPFRAAAKNYAGKTKTALNDLKKTMDSLGIKKGSKESAAVQKYGEGQYQDETGEVHEYTEVMLREEFPDSWQNIVKAAQYSRQIYDSYVDRINAVLEKIYPKALDKAMEDVEYQNSKAGLFTEMAEEQQRTYDSIRQRLDEKKAQLAKAREGTQRYADIQNTIHRLEQQMESVKGKINSLREQVDVSNAKAAAIQARIVSGEILRNKQLRKRTDYFHHFNEMAEGWAGLANILNTPTDIDSKLAGTSDNTRPKTRWAGFMQGRKGGKYTEDAVGGLLEYIPQAEYKIHFDPIIAENRNIIKALAEQTEDSRNANKFIEWLTDWTNDLAGKTNPFDRAVQKVISRKGISVAKWLSSRAKANAVVGNVRSATAQVFNLPNAMVYIKSPKAWKNGATIYARALGGDETAKSLYAESGFLDERYMDDAISQFDEGILKKPEKFANWMLTVGDKEVAKLIWASAYEQGRGQGVADPVEYADDITRRSIAGRGVGDIPLMQKAVITQLFAPFQIEVNNTWQLMKEAGAEKNWGGLLAMFALSFLMNSVTRELFGYDVAVDPFNALIEGAQNWDGDKTAAGNIMGMAGRMGGELLSNVPYGSQIGAVMISDEYDRERIFGDSDPSRFGTGNIGFDALADTVTSVMEAAGEDDISKVDLMTPLTNFLLPYGGKQFGRMIEGAQDIGMLPVASKEGFSRQPDAGSMSDSGRLRFAVDETNPFEVAKLFALGPFSTKGGMEYIEEGMLPLSEKRTAEAMAAAERGVDLVDYMNAYRAAAKADSTADKLAAVANFAENEEMAKELFGIVLGTEVKSEAGKPSQYGKMVAAMDEGMTAEEYVRYRQATKDLTKEADMRRALQQAGFTAFEAVKLLRLLG